MIKPPTYNQEYLLRRFLLPLLPTKLGEDPFGSLIRGQ
jgi:hypothetical protein